MDDPNATTLDLNVITPVPTVASPDDTIPEVPVQPVQPSVATDTPPQVVTTMNPPENLISPPPTNPTPVTPAPVSPTPTSIPTPTISPLVEDPDTVKLVGS